MPTSDITSTLIPLIVRVRTLLGFDAAEDGADVDTTLNGMFSDEQIAAWLQDNSYQTSSVYNTTILDLSISDSTTEYDIYSTAADLIEIGAARLVNQFDFRIEGRGDFKASQKHATYLKQAELYRRKAVPKTIDLDRSDTFGHASRFWPYY